MNNQLIKVLILNNNQQWLKNTFIMSEIENNPISLTYQYDFRDDELIEKIDFNQYALYLFVVREGDVKDGIGLCKKFRSLTDKPLLVLGKYNLSAYH